jgi:non-ribosomal peptide synthetase component F
MTNYKNENGYGREIISLEDPRIVDAETYEPPAVKSFAHNLAYIIYTSGSTGTPRGTMVEHRSVVRLVKNTNFIDFRETGRLLQTGALEFDASTFEIWGSLLNGWTLYLAPKDQILNPETLKHIIQRYLITTLWMTSPLFNQMSDTDIGIFCGLKHLLVGGDVLSPVHINRVRNRYPRLRVLNGYGPTENTTFSTTHLIDREYRENIPIGRPIANSTAYIVDRSDQPVPIGVPGELLVGGDGVSRGYMNNPELTNSKFQRGWHPQPIRNYKAPAGHPLSFSASQLPLFTVPETLPVGCRMVPLNFSAGLISN